VEGYADVYCAAETAPTKKAIENVLIQRCNYGIETFQELVESGDRQEVVLAC
jgi:hypothetical protein